MKTKHPAVEKEQLSFSLQPQDGSADEIITVEKNGHNQILSKSYTDVIFHVQLVPFHSFVFISPSWFQMTGYTPEELEADHDLLQKIVHPEDFKIFKKIKGTYEDITQPVVLRWMHKDGTIIWTEQTRTVIRNESGEPQALYIVVRDITEFRKTSAALEASEEKFSRVFQTSPNPVCIISLEKETFVDVNDSFLRASGYTREEVIGRTSVEIGFLVNNADLATMRNLLVQNGKISNQEVRTRIKSGEIRINLVAAEIVAIAGKPCTVLAITDITEQKWAEDALKESEAFTSDLLKNTPNPIFVVYPDSAIKYVNPAFENLTGYALTDIIGMKTPYPWWPSENMDDIQATLKDTHFGSGLKKEMEYQKKNGERFWVELTATAINKNAMREYILVNWVDITGRKQMEEALRFSDAALKSIHESIIAVDNNRTITYWNNISEQLYGIKASQAIGKSLKDVIKLVDEYPGQSLERVKKIKDTGYSRNELLITTKRGDIWVDTTTQIMKGGDIQYGYILTGSDITARKQAEKALQESEEKFSKAFNAASDAMAIFSSNGGSFLEVNDNYVKLSGYSRQELIGRNADELNMWASQEDRNRILKLSLEKGRFNNEEIKFRNKSGQVSICLFSAESIKLGDARRMIVVVQDITERKKMEIALRESEEKFFKAFNTSANAVAITNIEDKKFIEVNESFCRFTGYSREEVIGHCAEEFNLWVYKEELQKSIELLKRDGRIFNLEFSSRMKSGEIRIGLASVEIINIGGKPCRIRVITDITERKKMEKALQESEEKFSKAFTASANAICISYLKDGRCIEANESFTRFTGYTRDEIVGYKTGSLDFWVNPEEKQLWTDTTQKEGKVRNQEFSSRMKSGEIRFGLGSSDVINIGGEPCRIVVITDITERKKAEEALRESEEKFSKAFLASANSICITTLEDNRLIEVNESYSRFTGYTREEVIGRTAEELGLWVDKKELQQFRDLLKNGRFFHNLEMRSRTKSGEVRVGLASAEIISIGGKQCRIVAITDITERKKAEEALRVSEEKFSKAFREIPGAIGISTIKDGRFIDVNDSFYHVMGYTRQEAIGRTSKELNIWVEDESREKLVSELSTENHPRNKMIKFRKKSGEVGVGLFSVEKIVINNEPCMISVNMEVTQQIKAEESLKLLGSVTQQVTDSIIIIDPDYKITYMNKAAQKLLGYSIDEVLGADIGLFSDVPITRKTKKEITNTLALGKTWKAVLTKRRKDGTKFLCDCRRSPLFDENGRPSSYIVVYRDITEQKETEAKIKAQNLMVESILTSMPEGVLVTDSADRVILANESFRKIFHTGRKIIENKAINEVLRVGQLFDHYTSVKMGNTDVHSLEFRYKVKNAEKIIACVVIKMDIERMLLIFTDVSREREEEDKLYLMDRLASLGEMAAGLAHELNNPLTGILTLSQLLVNSDLPDQHKEDMQCVYDEAKRAASIVKNVLLFTRNNSYENGQSSVNDVVREVLRLREHEEKMKNISIITNLQENLPEIQLDKYQLQQVFLNIILNAEAAIEETNRPGTLTVTSEKVNNHINIMFADTGCGIKKHVLSRIFDPFFTTKEIGKGTGLGLSICYGIIVKHNGKISVKTQVGKGTTFTIRLPIATS